MPASNCNPFAAVLAAPTEGVSPAAGALPPLPPGGAPSS